MKPTVYIESTVVSYYTGRKTKDLVSNARRLSTDKWWKNRMPEFDSYISQLVLEEISKGDETAAKKRIDAVEKCIVLKLTDDALALAQELLNRKAIPKEFPEDAAHIAIAAAHGIGYLVTWNFAHINNAERKHAIEVAVINYGLEPPVICTPDELMGGAI